MSELLDAASSTLGVPTALIQRSSAARAAVTGATADEILSAWSGGAPMPAVSTAATTAPATADTPPVAAPVSQPVAVAAVIASVAVIEAPAPVPEVELDPVPLGTRVRTAVRVGAWTGAALGLVGFLVASAFWAPNAAILPEGGPVAQVGSTGTLIGTVLVSVLFGAIVASLSRAAARWANPAMELSTARSATAWTGALVGLLLGVLAGGILIGAVGTAIEDSEGLIRLPVLPTLAVMLIGGAILGALTAAIPQLLGTPVAVATTERDEAESVRRRLGDAIGVPLAGLILLLLLVLPFAYALIRSNELMSNGAAVIAIITAGGILGFATLAGSKPNIRISVGELMVAVVGIGTVLLIVLAVLVFRANEDHSADEPEETAIVRLF